MIGFCLLIIGLSFIPILVVYQLDNSGLFQNGIRDNMLWFGGFFSGSVLLGGFVWLMNKKPDERIDCKSCYGSGKVEKGTYD